MASEISSLSGKINSFISYIGKIAFKRPIMIPAIPVRDIS